MKIPASKVPAQVWADRMKRQLGTANEGEIECLERWEGSKQVYRINDALWDEAALDDASEIPSSVFKMMPYGCIFIQHREEVSMQLDKGWRNIHEREGYFCWLDGDVLSIGFLDAARRAEIGGMKYRDDNTSMVVQKYDLEDYKTLGDILMERRERETAVIRQDASRWLPISADSIEMAALELAHASRLNQVLGSLMYISSKEADVRTVYVPQRNPPRKSRQTDCTVHDVGFRIAPQLAEVRRYRAAEGHVTRKTGRNVAPHVRRAHWHGYWTGPRENPTGLEIKWIAPVVVNGQRGEPEGTVHDIGKEEGRYTVSSVRDESRGSARALESDREAAGRGHVDPSGREGR